MYSVKFLNDYKRTSVISNLSFHELVLFHFTNQECLLYKHFLVEDGESHKGKTKEKNI